MTLVDELPAELDATSSTGEGWECTDTGSTVTCHLDHLLGPGEEAAVTLLASISADASGSVVNQARVSAAEAEATLENNADTAVLNLQHEPAPSPTPSPSPTDGEGGAPPADPRLPRTGIPAFVLLVLGLGLIGAGSALLGARRRLRRHR